ncbi:MAG: hypothetical protein JWM33_2369 [Caulobacteraceae bacterium]|nr:hypothetical protein [Caulobacteraceae bacterium]
MDANLTLGLFVSALLAGAICAGTEAPFSLGWPKAGFHPFVLRLAMMRRVAIGRTRRRTGSALLALILAGGGLAAFAAQPSASVPAAPDPSPVTLPSTLAQLPSEVRGVVGSGDQLSLQLKTGAGLDHTLKVGEVYGDGWTLTGLTPVEATLAKDGATRQVGLNPTGALAGNAPVAPPSTVSMIGVPDADAVDRILKAAGTPVRAGYASPGLTEAETLRSRAYSALMLQVIDRERATGGPGGMTMENLKAVIGQAAYDDMTALTQRSLGASQAVAVADLAARPVSGPTSYYVPAGANEAQIVAAQGVDRRGVWEPGQLDAAGGRTFTLTAGTAEAYTARAANGPLPPPMAPAPPPPRPQGLAAP